MILEWTHTYKHFSVGKAKQNYINFLLEEYFG